MKTKITTFALSLAVACAASTGLAQQSRQADAASDSVSGAYFQEVAIDGVGDLAPGDYIQPAFSGGSGDGGCAAGACSTGCCDTGCGGGCCDTGCSSCCRNPFAHRSGLFADFLYLRARDAEVAIAVPSTPAVVGPIPPATPVPQGRTLSLDPDHQPAYRVGANLRLSDQMSMRLAYTDLESSTRNGGAIVPGGTNVFFPLLLHPATQRPDNINPTTVAGRYDIDYEAVDLDARLLLWSTKTMAINAVGGARWTELDQDLLVRYTNGGGTVIVGNTQFDGIGARMGLEGEFRAANGFGAYAGGVLSLMFGDSRCRVSQTDIIAGPEMFTNDEFGRLAPIFEMEFGAQWVSRGGRVRAKAGYMSSQWFNIVTVRDYVNGIRQNQFDDFSDTITFDGFTTGLEVAF